MTTTTTATVRNNTITISQTVTTDELFDSVIGSDFYGCTDFIVPRSLEVDETNKKISFKYLDVDNLDSNGYYIERKKTITINKLATAYSQLVQNNQTHCGNYAIADLENSDGCFGYLVLQQAIYGKLNF
jgi:hypothetical protein